MELEGFARHGSDVRSLFEGLLEVETDNALSRMVNDQQWDALAIVAITAAEGPARRIVMKLLEKQRFMELAMPACLRRQVRKQDIIIANPGRTARILRDVDAETDAAGIPEHILQEAQDIAEAADNARVAALNREAGIDRDPLREFIVNEIAKSLNTSPEAAEALMAIAKAGAFEDARRAAALKLNNNEIVMKRLAREGRGADMIVVANNSGLASVRTNVARALGPVLGAMRAQSDWASLRWAGEHHPDPKAREAIAQVLSEEAE